MHEPPLMIILRTLIWQADRHPGKDYTAELKRGLVLCVHRSTSSANYKLLCGRKNNHAGETELNVVTANWPQKIETPVEWRRLEADDPKAVHYMVAIIKPLPQQATQ